MVVKQNKVNTINRKSIQMNNGWAINNNNFGILEINICEIL